MVFVFFFNYKIMNAFFIPLNGGFNFAKIWGFKVTDYTRPQFVKSSEASYGWLRSFADAQATLSMTVAFSERRRGQVPLIHTTKPSTVYQAYIS